VRTIYVAGLLALLTAGRADAQLGPWSNNQQFGPNVYNRMNQPLSPYLNLLRGGSPAINYFYGVRPGLMSGGYGQGGGYYNQGFMRQTFFPQIDTLYELDETNGRGLPPTGHPFAYNNQMGYYGAGSLGAGAAGMGMRNMRQNQQQGQPLATRPGMLSRGSR
jgi:hypothetical protein